MKNHLKEIRRDRGFSQHQLAELVNSSQPQIERLENGKRKLTVEWARRLAVPLECHWAELIEDSPVTAEDEQEILEIYRGLPDAQKSLVRNLISTIADSEDVGSENNNSAEDGPQKATDKRNFATRVLACAALLYIGLMAGVVQAESHPRSVDGYGQAKDGDTIYVDGMALRLDGIDAPEMQQVCTHRTIHSIFFPATPEGPNHSWNAGKDSRGYLKYLMEYSNVGAGVRCYWNKTDRYKRPLATCYVRDLNLNAEMVRTGHAWAYCTDPPACRKYSGEYLPEQAIARESFEGVWGSDCEPAWIWRKKNQQ